MCGRKTLTKGKLEILEELSIDEWEEEFIPSYNIAPTQFSPILRNINGKKTVRMMHWGLVPSWSKDRSFAAKMINARCETIDKKPSYRNLIRGHRCIVISDGYFEWRQTEYGKIPYFIHREDSGLMLMAGLWDIWKADSALPLFSYTVITTSPSPQIKHIHNRMPVVLNPNSSRYWLSGETDIRHKSEIFAPFTGNLESYPVSRIVNKSSNNSPDCIRRIHSND